METRDAPKVLSYSSGRVIVFGGSLKPVCETFKIIKEGEGYKVVEG